MRLASVVAHRPAGRAVAVESVDQNGRSPGGRADIRRYRDAGRLVVLEPVPQRREAAVARAAEVLKRVLEQGVGVAVERGGGRPGGRGVLRAWRSFSSVGVC